jgi:hypothetical protein
MEIIRASRVTRVTPIMMIIRASRVIRVVTLFCSCYLLLCLILLLFFFPPIYFYYRFAIAVLPSFLRYIFFVVETSSHVSSRSRLVQRDAHLHGC